MLGDRLKQFRLAKGYSLDDLVLKTNGIVSKVALSKYERGLMKPSKQVLAALADAFNTKVLYLINEPSFKYELIAFRINSTLKVKDRKNIENLILTKLEERVKLQILLHPTKISDLPLGLYNISNSSDVEAAAVNLRKKWNIGLDPISNLIDLLESHFIHVFLIKADSKFDGISAVCHNEEGELKTAAVASRNVEAGERQRFNLAHELAHLVLNINTSPEVEKIAHHFAGAFLAPKDEVIKLVGAKRTSFLLNELMLYKNYFGMSMQALIYRFYDLDIINSSNLKWWFKYFNTQGYKKKEPGMLKPEIPSYWESVVFNAYSENIITKKDAERYLDKTIDGLPVQNAKTEFLKLSKEERSKVLTKQADKFKSFYNDDTHSEDLETGEIDGN